MSSSEFHERFRSNPLCDFRLGTVATSDHETPLTGYEPKKDLNLVNTEELDLAATSDIYWQHTLDDDASLNDPNVDDNQLAKHLAVVVDSTGKPVEMRSDNDLFSGLVVNAYSSNTRQLGRVFQDMGPPKSTTIFRKSSNILKPFRCVRFSEAVLRHANIRDQNLSLGMICAGDPHQPDPNAPKIEDRSQEETEWQERCAREAAWRLAKKFIKLKEKHKTAFFSPLENWCLPAPSAVKPEERELVWTLEHMISKKDLNDDELTRHSGALREASGISCALEKMLAVRCQGGVHGKGHRRLWRCGSGQDACLQW